MAAIVLKATLSKGFVISNFFFYYSHLCEEAGRGVSDLTLTLVLDEERACLKSQLLLGQVEEDESLQNWAGGNV